MARVNALVAAVLIATPLVRGVALDGSQDPQDASAQGAPPQGMLPGRSSSSLYVEVVGSPVPGGASIQSVESNFMSTLLPGAGAFKLMDDDLIAHDELYRTRVLNFLYSQLNKMGMNCASNRYCIEDWLRQANRGQGDLTLEPMRQFTDESMQKGCLTMGGCRKALEDSFNFHLKNNHNMIFETSGVSYPDIQKRVGLVKTVGQYRSNTLGLVCTPWAEVEATQLSSAAASIASFLQRPKDMPAPAADRVFTNKLQQRLILCTMSDILSCMSRTGSSVRTATGTGTPHPCNPTPDGVYVWAHSASATPQLAAFPQHGGSETDEHFINARKLIKSAMPPGVPDCKHSL